MRKKLFAVLMMVTMMVTFMPSMSFATMSQNTDESMIHVFGAVGDNDDTLTWENIDFDSYSYLVDSKTGEVKNFRGGFKATIVDGIHIELNDEKYDAKKFELKAETTNGVALYWTQIKENKSKESYYDASKVSPKFEISGGKWVDNKGGCDFVPVVKSDLYKSKAFSIKLTLLSNGKTIETKTLKFDPEYLDEENDIYSEAKIGDTYYRHVFDAIHDVKAGQTIEQVYNFSLKGPAELNIASVDWNMPTDKAFTIQGNLDMYVVPPEIGDDTTMGQNITYKNVCFYEPDMGDRDILIDSNTTLINCTAGYIYVREDSKNVKLKNVIVSQSITINENASVTLTGKIILGEINDIFVEKRAKVDASGLTEYEGTFTVRDSEHHEVKLPKDDRWYYENDTYALSGVFVYNNETYKYPWEVASAAKGDLNPTLKIVGDCELNLDGYFDQNASITITGTTTGCVESLNWGEDQNVVVKSGIFRNYKNIYELIPSNVSILQFNNFSDRKNDKGQMYCVGGALIKEVLSRDNSGVKASNERQAPVGVTLLRLGTDLSIDTICNIVAEKRDEFMKTMEFLPLDDIELKLTVADEAEKDLLAVGKEYNQDITKYLNFYDENAFRSNLQFKYLSVYGVQLANKKYVALTEDEYLDYQKSWKTVSRYVDNTKVTVKSSALSTSSAKLYANKSGFGVEVAGKNGKVTGLKAGAIKTYTAKPYATVGNGKVKVYGKAQKVVVKSRAYTPAVKVGKKSIKVSFNKMSGAKKYQVSVSRSKTKTNLKSSSAKRSLKIKNLKSQKTYYVKVRTVNSKGVKGAWSAVKAVKVK